MPFSERVTKSAVNSMSEINFKPFSMISSSELHLPTTASNSDIFGVSKVAPR